MSNKPISLQRIEYEEAAEAYLRSLPPEHFMESTTQAQQRKITLESLDLVALRRPEVQVFNELLLQYRLRRDGSIRQVVPDNMVVVHAEKIKAEGSYDVPLQPVGPFWVLEYVSKRTKRKDYDDNFQKYEGELKVPYYLLFYPDNQELTLYRRSRGKYVSVKPNAQGRYAIVPLSLEMAILGGWVRFWFSGQLLPLPADLQRDLDAANRRADDEKRRADDAERELARLRQELERLRSR
jgi:Uma2 family endonuclease